MIEHLVICRARGERPDGASAQAKYGYEAAPTRRDILGLRAAIAEMFEASFGVKPARVAVVVLPWVDEEDGHD